MEPLAGIEADIVSFFDDQTQEISSSDGCKQVPWLSWEEWDSVRESLFSSSPDEVSSALKRVAIWRSRGSLPAPVDVTSSLIEIQLKDGFIPREKQSADALYSEHLLQMLYCMGILRLVNCVIEKTRRRTSVSIADAAKAIGIPRKLIDLRHEGSHRELPALSVLRDASDEALTWLKSYYWEPQKYQIPVKKDGTASIKSKLRKLAFYVQLKHNPQFDSNLVKGRCSKKRIMKIVSSLVELYPSFSTEITSMLLEFLLKALDSSKSAELQNQSGQDLRVFLDEWKPLILEFTNREPELLLTLLQTVLDMIPNNEQQRYETDMHLKEKEVSQVEQLPFLFSWLVSLLNGSKHFQRNSSLEVKPPKIFLMELIRKSMLLGAFGYTQVLNSGLQLAEIAGGSVLKDKLIKLSGIRKHSASVPLKQSSALVATPEILLEQEKTLDNASKKLEFLKLQLSKKKCNGTDTDEAINNVPKRWSKAKTWSPCPIGMLPRTIGYSGRLPLLDSMEVLENESISKQAQGGDNAKREAEWNTQQVENSTHKRARTTSTEDLESNDVTLESYDNETEIEREDAEEKTEAEDNLMMNVEEIGSCLMISGEWKRVRAEELLSMASNVKLLV